MLQHNPPHPGEILHDLWLEPLGLSMSEFAKRIGVSRKTISEIVNGKSCISPEMALRLELALGKSAKSWLSHQAAYDLWQLDARRGSFAITRIAA